MTDESMIKKTFWLNRKGHFQGLCWTILACFFSNLCDSAVKVFGAKFPPIQITFCRLFIGTLILLPIMLLYGRNSFSVNNKLWQFLRILIGFGAISCWIYGASQTSLPSITTISFVCPILVFPLAYLFLGEKSDWKRILSIFLGFLGVLIVALFEKGEIQNTGSLFLHPGVIFLTVSAFLFATSDILNKKMLQSENLLSLLFYFYLGTALVSLIPAFLVWKPIEYKDVFGLLTLGFGGVSILYCILKAANATEISSIAPYKYIELVISIVVGYFFFGEIIKLSTIIGAGLIIPSALFIAYHEIRKNRESIVEEEIAAEPVYEEN
jgi:S-adenosylmethionine uptake transporter